MIIIYFLFSSVLWATDGTITDLRSPDQFEEAPNEPPFNTSTIDAESDASETQLDPVQRNEKFVPRWKRPRSKTPTVQRLDQLNKEKGLFKITKKNEYIYDVKKSPQSHAFSFRFGTLSLTNLANNEAGFSYDDIYGENTSILFLLDWEWQFFKSLGKLGVKFGSGVSLSQGSGRFASTSVNSNLDALEQYSFYILPNSISAVYRADYFNNQYLVPFAEVGGDYFTFAETRDDGKFSYGAAPAWHMAVGASLLLDWVNPQTMITLDKESGINHIYLTAEYRKIFGLSEAFDFSDDVISGGFFIEY